uniref:exodeoxyribonuclease III n=1 Tax=Leptobrachium leishanense TaxID=445787 RepID=A0A8C5PZ66_9ANUR
MHLLTRSRSLPAPSAWISSLDSPGGSAASQGSGHKGDGATGDKADAGVKYNPRSPCAPPPRNANGFSHFYSFFCFLFFTTFQTAHVYVVLLRGREIHRFCSPQKLMTLVSYNVKGLNVPFKRHSLYAEFRRLGTEVVCLQETHFKWLTHPMLNLHTYPIRFHATDPSKAKGASILVQCDVAFQLHRKLSDPRGRYLILVCSINHTLSTQVNVYSPNTNPLSFLSGVLRRTQQLHTGCLLVCGDFNFSIDPIRDVQSDKIPPPTKQQIRQGRTFTELLPSFQPYDLWRTNIALLDVPIGDLMTPYYQIL